MLDFGIDKLALIGAVALIVIGPERLPRVARTVGVLLGKAQRYVSQVQSEVNRSIELDDLKKMKSGLEDAARDMGQQVQTQINEAQSALNVDPMSDEASASYHTSSESLPFYAYGPPVRKNWRLKRGSTPLWYKQKHGVRRQVQSSAARVARFRPQPMRGPH
jgi:sec-independent protein translocase protein TatB